MATASLPQLERLFLTDAGLETDILFNRGIDLPHFASITLLQTADGRQALQDYYRGFLELARRMGTGLVLESATWRSSPDWAEPLGLSLAELDALNADAISMLIALREEYRSDASPIIVSGCIGPRGDGYDPGRIMSVDEAQAYHAHQAQIFRSAGVDMIAAITMTNIPEATGLARAAKARDVPVAISFTVETDGNLPTGDTLGRCRCCRRRGDPRLSGLLYDQLRAPHAFCRVAGGKCAVDRPHSRRARECVHLQPCRTGCDDRTRHR